MQTWMYVSTYMTGNTELLFCSTDVNEWWYINDQWYKVLSLYYKNVIQWGFPIPARQIYARAKFSFFIFSSDLKKRKKVFSGKRGVIKIVKQNQQHSVVINDDAIFIM